MDFRWLGVDTPYLTVGAVGNVIVSAWRVHATPEQLRPYREILFKAADEWPQGIASIVYLADGMKPPDNIARDIITAFLRDLDAKLIAYATVMSGEGFVYAGLRALSSTFTLVSRNKSPQKFLPTIDEAVSWIRPHLDKRPPVPTSDRLRAGLRQVVKQLNANPLPPGSG
jgi:hypothetical protein